MKPLDLMRRRLLWEVRRLMQDTRATLALAMVASLASVALIAVVATAITWVQLQPLRSALEQAQTAAQSLTPARPLRTVQQLPAHTELPAQLKRIYQAAEAAQVRLNVAEYRTRTEPDGALMSVSVAASASDDFARIQRALIEILHTLPNAGLESVSLRRADRNGTRVDARIHLVLYLHATAERAP